VAEAENVSRAALKLHVSQPGISRQIRDLEDEIGIQLFERTAKSVKLSPAGKIFVKEARAVLQRAEEALKNVRAAAGDAGELHVGYAPSLTARFLPPALRAFQAILPKVRVKLHDCSSEEMATGLRVGKLHLALTVRAARGIFRDCEFTELGHDTLCLAVAPKHRLAVKWIVTIEEIAHERLIIYSRKDYPEAYKFLLNLFARVKLKPRVAEEHDSVSSLIAAVETGNGVAVVARSLECTSGPRLKLIPLSPAPEPIVVGAAWIQKLTPAAEQFLNCARQFAIEK
ncbi:MAG TPA: LysR family transcriptional regulator, partial [Verrucomicrobiae bacterium]|nr:LysR family transcriptional regulator [Verrucomicrobiae bacterium]